VADARDFLVVADARGFLVVADARDFLVVALVVPGFGLTGIAFVYMEVFDVLKACYPLCNIIYMNCSKKNRQRNSTRVAWEFEYTKKTAIPVRKPFGKTPDV
jgi:hypothetical protein